MEAGPGDVEATRDFSAYLATRPDLVPISSCATLARAGRDLLPLPRSQIHEMLAQSLGPHWRQEITFFDESPLEVRTACQVHAAVVGGAEACVMLSKPWEDTVARLRDDVLAVVRLPEDIQAAALSAAVADFAADCRHAADVHAQRNAWRILNADSSSPARSALVDEHDLGRNVLLLYRVDGLKIFESAKPVAAIRSVSAAWFSSVLLGRPFSLEPLGRWTLAEGTGTIVWGGGPLDTLPIACAHQLRAYLLAVAADEPDRACSQLTGMFQGVSPGGELRLARELRQFVPARDWKWPGCRTPVAVADHVLGHWRAIASTGARAPRHLLSFYRGLFGLATTARDIDPHSDAIADGFHDALVNVGFAKARHLFSLDGIRTNAFDLAHLAAILPRGIDDALSGAAEEQARATQDDAWMQVEQVDLSNRVLWSVTLMLVAREVAPASWTGALSPVLFAAALALLSVVAFRAVRRKTRR